jgi:uncharacterized protein (DUF488 family)
MGRRRGLVSVGYEGRTVDELIQTLQDEGVDVLADVRLTPLSLKPGLSKHRLAQRLDDVDIRYVHLRGPGNPRDNRAAFWNGPIEVGIARFRRMLSAPEERAAELKELAELAGTARVAILCFERDHARCHRQVVTEEIIRRSPRKPELALA